MNSFITGLLVCVVTFIICYSIYKVTFKETNGINEYHINLMLYKFKELENKLINHYLEPQIDVLEPTDNDFFVLTLLGDEYGNALANMDDFHKVYKNVLKKIGNRPLIAIPDYTILKTCGEDEIKRYIKLLENTIDNKAGENK